MTSLQRHVVKGRTYWRIVESRRVNGKPRAVPVLYLGTAGALLQRLLEGPSGACRIRTYQHGDVAALKAAADRLDVVSIIDKHVAHRRRGLSVGTTLLLAALNRASKPRSKRGWAQWAAQTSLPQLFPDLQVEALSSQFFWDQMDCISLDALRAIENELTTRVVRELGIELDTLFYDTTNFFTYIASTNAKPKLPQRGKSKQKRSDLRLFGLALLVSRDGQIPLCSDVYEGNKVDSTRFPESLSRIRQRLAALSMDLTELTIVYDAGNVSKANQALVDKTELGYVAALAPTQHSDLMAIPVNRYDTLPEGSRVQGVPVLRLRQQIWGAERTVVLFVSKTLRAGQIRGLEQHLHKRINELEQWKQQLGKPKARTPAAESVQKRIAELVQGQHLGEVLRIEYHPERSGSDRLQYWIDQAARRHVENEVFGKRILVTNRDQWSAQEILLAYRGQSHVEAVFRQSKDDEHLTLRPQYHWTDQKIHVHAFICMLALLLARMVEREARKLGHRESLSALLDLLATLRLAMVLRPPGKAGGRPRTEWQLEVADDAVVRLFRALVPNQRPFVYTDSAD